MNEGSSRSIMTKVLDCSFEVSEFKLQLRYYVHIRLNTFEESMKSLIPSAMD